MCAIFGILGSYEPSRVEEAFNKLRHRGLSDRRLVLEKAGAWGMHRLAIESANEPLNQPFESNGVVVLFNGEIYNYKSLALELNIEGSSEVEIIFRAWQRWGKSFVEHLRGMYAIAIIEPELQRIHLFRDPVGKKPLFYLLGNGYIAFASEAKALYSFKPFFLERRNIVQYLGFQSTIAPYTLDKEIKKLEIGGSVELSLTNVGKEIHYKPFDPWLDMPIEYFDKGGASKALKEALEESIALRIPSKVAWGVLLSGGLDSSLVASLASRYSTKPIDTFSIGYDGYKSFDERAYAQKVAKYLGANHHSYNFTKIDFFETLEELLSYLDEPLGDPAMIPLLFLMKKAKREGVDVLLGGEGSDELLLGYRTYREFNAVEQASSLPYKRWLKNYFRKHPSQNKEWEWYKRAWSDEPIFRSSAELYTDLQLNRLLKQNVRDGQNLEPITPYIDRFNSSKRSYGADWYSYLDLKVLLAEVYLLKQDRVSMLAGIEARSPFLDRGVIETVFSISPELRMKTSPKGILKELAKALLPSEIIHRKKKGLNYPFIEWILEEDGVEVLYRVQKRFKLFNEEQLDFLTSKANKGKFRQHLFPLYLLARWLELKL